MFVYEVRVSVKQERADEYAHWLKHHMRDIVEGTSFLEAASFVESDTRDAGRVHFLVHYKASDRAAIDFYLQNLALRFRADALQRFGDDMSAERAVWKLQDRVPDLTEQSVKREIDANHRKDVAMNSQASWSKLRTELQRLTDVEHLKNEANRIGAELRNFDFQKVLSPTAQARVKIFEKRYAELMRTVHQAQRQMDREFNRLMRQVKTQKAGVTKTLNQHRSKLEKASMDLRKRFVANGFKMNAMKKTKAKKATAKTSRMVKRNTKRRKA